MKSVITMLKEAYNPNHPYNHEHVYDHKVIQDIVEPVFSSKEDEVYYNEHFDRWQGDVKKIGEDIFFVCNVCKKREIDIIRLTELWKSFDDVKMIKKDII